VPVRDPSDSRIASATAALEEEWAARAKLAEVRGAYLTHLAGDLRLDGEDSRLRWLAYKPPE
jgi:hypothetical protein